MADQSLARRIGKNIKQMRLTRAQGQGAVAEKLQISVAALSKIENGLTDINLSRLAQVANMFQVSIVELITNETGAASINQLFELDGLKQEISTKDAEIFRLQKKVIDLYEKLNP